jgi:hypothetical protein
VTAVLRLEEGQRPGPGDVPDVLAEVDEDRDLGADLDDGGEGGAGIAPAEQLGEDPQVRAAGDREELGEALQGAEDQGLQEVLHGDGSYGQVIGVPSSAPPA